MLTFLAKYVYLTGARWRNPSLGKIYKELKYTESFSREELEKLQLTRLRYLLTFANDHSPYYSNVFTRLGFKPEIQSLEELKALPTITKQTLIKENANIHSTHPFSKRMLAETSGTSGEALEFYRNEEWDSVNRANVMRNYDWYGVKVWDKNGYFWGYNIDNRRSGKVRLLDRLQNRTRIFRYDDKSITAFAKELTGAKYLAGYSSMIYQIAKKVNQLGLKIEGVRMVKGTSEMILDAYQPEVQAAFGQRMVSEYGAAESGLIAFECPEGNMHINMESVLVETDENNEIIVTNLASLSFPVIRYRLGDMVKLSDEKCPCGREHKILSEIMGRKGANILGHKGEYPALTFYYVFKNIALEKSVLINYKAEQHEKGKVKLNIEGQEHAGTEALISSEMEKYFKNDLDFEIQFITKFDQQTKKQQYFESFIG